MAIISMCHGTLNTLLVDNRFSQVSVKNNLTDMRNFCKLLRESWPNRIVASDFSWTLTALYNWHEKLRELGVSDRNKTLTLVRIGSIASGDLLAKLSNPTRIKQMTILNSFMNELDDMLDPIGQSFLSTSDADKILTSFYKEIDFVVA